MSAALPPYISWTRFVHAPNQSPALERGFLLDPDGGFWNPSCKPLDEFFDLPGCAVLLGAPGSGKSTEMKRAWHSKARAPGCFIDAAKENPVERLRDLHTQLAGHEELRIFVDALDESLQPSTNPVAGVLRDIAAELETFPLARVSLCVSCRSAMWNDAAQNAIEPLARRVADARAAAGRPLPGQDKHDSGARRESGGAPPWLRVRVLAPLRAVDVERAAANRIAEHQRFIDEVTERELGVLAARPLTLEFLLARYARRRALPSRVAEVMEQGCLDLLDRINDDRLARESIKPSLTLRQRWAVAQRIAAVTVLCGRPRVVIGAEHNDAGDCVCTADIAGPEPGERADGSEFVVEPHMVAEVLKGTALFDGDGRAYRWVHRALAEFLASRYLLAHRFAVAQVLDLFGYGEGPDALVPQLEGVARWIDDSFPDELRQRIIELDPLAALRGDLASRSDADKALIVDRLLATCGEVSRQELFFADLGKLAYPGLAAQLRPTLVNSQARLLARLLCTWIAKKCKLAALAEELARIALDASQPADLREHAAFAVCESGPSAGRRRLLELFDQPPDRTTHDLRGCALQVAWEDRLLAIEEIFARLEPGRASYISLYETIYSKLTSELAGQVKDFDGGTLLAGLAWARRAEPDLSARLSTRVGSTHLAAALWEEALARLDQLGMAAAVAGDILQQLADHADLSWYRERTDGAQRRALTAALLERLTGAHTGSSSPMSALWLPRAPRAAARASR